MSSHHEATLATSSAEVTPRHALLPVQRPTVAWTSDIAAFVEASAATGRAPVLATSDRAVLTEHTHRGLRQAGGRWIVQDGTRRAFAADTGQRVTSLDDLDADPASNAERHPRFADDVELGATVEVLRFDCVLQHRVDWATRIGGSVELMLAFLGDTEPTHWGLAEPTSAPWDIAHVTELARARMPSTPPLLVESATARASLTVHRTERGIVERCTGTVAIPAAGAVGSGDAASAGDAEWPLRRAKDALRAANEAWHVTAAFVELDEVRADRLVAVGPAPSPAPVAMLIGPRGVRNLDVDVDRLVERGHDVEQIGRQRTPSLLAGLWQGAWSAPLRLAYDLTGPGRHVRVGEDAA